MCVVTNNKTYANDAEVFNHYSSDIFYVFRPIGFLQLKCE